MNWRIDIITSFLQLVRGEVVRAASLHLRRNAVRHRGVLARNRAGLADNARSAGARANRTHAYGVYSLPVSPLRARYEYTSPLDYTDTARA